MIMYKCQEVEVLLKNKNTPYTMLQFMIVGNLYHLAIHGYIYKVHIFIGMGKLVI